MMTRKIRTRIAWAFVVALSVIVAHGQVSPVSGPPRPVRNDVARHGQELLVLRHHQLRKGGHDEFYRLSREDVWPFFERNGARIVGQWQIVESEPGISGQFDEVYRLARYAGFEHWQATRSARSSGAAAAGGSGGDVALGGNGPAQERSIQGFAQRGGLEIGSRGAYFLTGHSAPGGPYFMPGLDEQYALVRAGERPALTEAAIPVRLDVAQPGAEIVEIRYQRIQKGSYEKFIDATRTAVWPWEEKLGARPLGQWKVVYPPAPNRTAENPAYDEIVTLTRYASRAHREAMRPDAAVFMGGNGADYDASRSALRLQQSLTLLTNVELAQGFMYHSPPKFLPGLPERYQLKK
jgi:hypothetical protein